ncbi:orf124 [Sucra jujuba nucleopolyhedrovirus]|uniref:Orf124 n=1 Tax=Sucra jujuba nucleopolyhedrovirus TaxID=1563660 RepID=A0A097P968_9ABAC|nr:orf124 [Sucra jujuba nucleopolyhedrovirus]AIU41363.1 orf124 [Sucra jujuba nucleopolyhedrovirus]
MNALRVQLFDAKTLPYISKKNVNDTATQQVLSQMDQEFFVNVYNQVLDTVGQRHMCVLKGSAAVAAHLNIEDACLNDLSIKVCVEQELSMQNLFDLVPLTTLENRLRTSIYGYSSKVQKICEATQFSTILKGSVSSLTSNNIEVSNKLSEFTMFKSYTNEAVRFETPEDIALSVNAKKALKVTICAVDNDENNILVRYSISVLAKNQNPLSAIWLYKTVNGKNHCSDICKRLDYFAFDLHFLNLYIKKETSKYTFLSCFNTQPMIVEDLENVIIDQIECMLFNVFYQADDKLNAIQKRTHKLFEMWRSKKCDEFNNLLDKRLQQQQQIAAAVISRANERFSIKDLRRILQLTGLVCGLPLIDQLIVCKRFKNTLADVTHQINFPYHVWYPDYYEKCWNKFRIVLSEFCGSVI